MPRYLSHPNRHALQGIEQPDEPASEGVVSSLKAEVNLSRNCGSRGLWKVKGNTVSSAGQMSKEMGLNQGYEITSHGVEFLHRLEI